MVIGILRTEIAARCGFVPEIVWQFAMYCIAKGAEAQTAKDIHYPSWQFSRLPMVDLCTTVWEALDGQALAVLLEAICDNVRFQNSHTRFAVGLLLHFFERAADEAREVMAVTLIRRVLCVTSPPNALKGVLAEMIQTHGKELEMVLGPKGEWSLFKDALAASERFVKRSSSGMPLEGD
jgi:hypothetical protein